MSFEIENKACDRAKRGCLLSTDCARQGGSDARPPLRFQVLVTCLDEADQRELYEQMSRAGRKCRVLVL
jgi:hypothetical protein